MGFPEEIKRIRQRCFLTQSFIFTLIQKFNKSDAEPIYPDHDIIHHVG